MTTFNAISVDTLAHSRTDSQVGPQTTARRDLGAVLVSEGTRFRVWAPRREQVDVVFEGAGGAR